MTPQPAPANRLVNPNARRQVIITIIAYLVYIAVSIFHVWIYTFSEGRIHLNSIVPFIWLLWPPVYHIGFLIINRKKRYWYYEQALTACIMSVITFIAAVILISIFPNYGGWEHFLDGIELFIPIIGSVLRMAYVPIITYLAWRICNKGQTTTLQDHYPKKILRLTTLVALFFLVFVLGYAFFFFFFD